MALIWKAKEKYDKILHYRFLLAIGASCIIKSVDVEN